MATTVIRPASHLMRRKFLPWLPTLFWLGVIAAFSTDTFSAEHTGRILWRIVHGVFPFLSVASFETLHFFVRKTAHFTVYGILSGLAFFSWRLSLPGRERWTTTWSGLALAVTLLAGTMDEFHQSFVPSRTSSARDVMLDMFGALCFQAAIMLVLKRRRATPIQLPADSL